MSTTDEARQPVTELDLQTANGFWAVRTDDDVYYVNALARRLYRASRRGTDPGEGVGRWVQLAPVRRLPDRAEWTLTVGHEHEWRVDEPGWARLQCWTTLRIVALEALTARQLRDRVGAAAALDTVDMGQAGAWILRTPGAAVYVDTGRWEAYRQPTLDGPHLPGDGQWALLASLLTKAGQVAVTLEMGAGYTVLAAIDGGSTSLAWPLDPLVAIEPLSGYPLPGPPR